VFPLINRESLDNSLGRAGNPEGPACYVEILALVLDPGIAAAKSIKQATILV